MLIYHALVGQKLRYGLICWAKAPKFLLDKVDVASLAVFDLEYLFLQLRGKSVGEEIELQMKHTSGNECKHVTPVKLNIDDIKVQGKVSDGKIMIDENIGVKLNYPSFETVMRLSKSDNNTDTLFNTIAYLIDYVYDKDEVYNEFTEDEMVDWISKLNQKQFQKITGFMEDMPKLKQKIEWTCPKCNQKDSIELEGLQSFFI